MDLGLANAAAVVGRTRASLDSAVTDLTDRGSRDAVGLVTDIGDAGIWLTGGVDYGDGG